MASVMTVQSRETAWLTWWVTLVAVAASSWSRSWWSVRGDETPYICAFEAMKAGLDPYRCEGFFYPPPMAAWGGWLLNIGDVPMVVSTLRLTNALGLGWLAAISATRLTESRLGRWIAATALVVLAPGSVEALEVGNLSPLVAALTWAALLRWPRHPSSAGALLGIGIAIKPIALAALPLLALAPTRSRLHRQASRECSAYAGLVVLAAHLPWLSLLPSMLSQAPRHDLASGNVSAQRVARLLELPLPSPMLVFVFVTLAGAALVWQVRPQAERVSHAILVTSLLSLPVVWSHTFVTVWPLAMAALGRSWRRFRNSPQGAERRRNALSVLLVGQAVGWTLSTNALTWLHEILPARLNALPTVVALLLPAGLCWSQSRISGTQRGPTRDAAAQRN